MKKNILIIVGLALFTATCMMSCKFDELSDASLQFDGDYATSLLTTRMEIGDIVGELDSATTVELDEDGLLHLIYRGDFTQKSSSDVFASIPQFPVLLTDTFYTLPYPVPNGMILEYLRLKTADVSFFCESPFTENVSLEIEFPEVTNATTGEVFKYNTVIPYLGTTPAQGAGAMNLAGWHMTPDNGEIHIRYKALLPDGTRVELDDFYMIFQNFEASYFEGYLGQEVYDLPQDTIVIDFFDRWVDGGVIFEDPSINVIVENSFGLPVRSIANTMNIWNLDGSILEIQSSELETGINFNYPALDEVGESKFTSFSLDKTNSNITSIFANRPVAVEYDLDALGNPDGDQSIIGFATDTSFFTVNVFVDLPMHATVDNFTIKTDVEIGEDFEEDYDFVDYITLKVISDNNIPVDMALQLYFEDENGIAMDSLFDKPRNQLLNDHIVIKAAGVDENGYSNSTTYNEVEIEIPREKFDAFSQMKNLAVVTILDHDQNQLVRFFDVDDVNLKIGVKAGLSQ